MTKKEFNLHQADQQLTGFAHAKSGYDALSLVHAMGLTKQEWKILKRKFLVLDYLNKDDASQIEKYMRLCHTKNT